MARLVSFAHRSGRKCKSNTCWQFYSSLSCCYLISWDELWCTSTETKRVFIRASVKLSNKKRQKWESRREPKWRFNYRLWQFGLQSPPWGVLFVFWFSESIWNKVQYLNLWPMLCENIMKFTNWCWYSLNKSQLRCVLVTVKTLMRGFRMVTSNVELKVSLIYKKFTENNNELKEAQQMRWTTVCHCACCKVKHLVKACSRLFVI